METLVINLSEAEMEYEAFCELSVLRTVRSANCPFCELYNKRRGIETEISRVEAEAGTGELFRQAGGYSEAGFFYADDGGEYAG